MTTIHELVEGHSVDRPHCTALVLTDGEGHNVGISYSELQREVELASAELVARAEPGARVLLMHRSPLTFAVGFLASLRAEMLPVAASPAATPTARGIAEAVVKVAAPSLVSMDRDGGQLQPQLRDPEEVFSGIDSRHLLNARSTMANGSAFLQFSSGSTREPKGICISHDNLIENQELIRETYGQSSSSVIVGWLPLNHDMGLVGTLLHPLYLGATAVLMEPTDFLRDPTRWPRALSAFKATLTAAPNFAFDLVSRKSDPVFVRSLDLTSLQVAVCGGEPVRQSTLDRFQKLFEPAGLGPTVVCPAYGLAEATLLVSSSTPGQPVEYYGAGPHEGVVGSIAVSCGDPGSAVAIVDESGATLPAGEVGEITVSHGSVASGYFNDEEATRQTFVELEAGSRRLHTGDLGVIVAGRLFVVGRSKDRIVVRGVNHCASDLEVTAEQSSDLVRPGCVAVVQVGDVLGVVAEIAGALDEASQSALGTSIRRAIAQQHGIQVNRVKFVGPGEIPKTSSGKLRRFMCGALLVPE